jgi:hypothetical protein
MHTEFPVLTQPSHEAEQAQLDARGTALVHLAYFACIAHFPLKPLSSDTAHNPLDWHHRHGHLRHNRDF